MNNFWQNLERPFFCLAPMDDVTDVVFREVMAKISRPDVFFTEFTNCDGLVGEGGRKVGERLKFTENQHPIVAQIWGNNPTNYFKVAQKLVKMGFDGIDINMGCPERGITKKGCCSGLIDNHDLAKKIIDATKKGAAKLPVSVKTRLGFKKLQTEEWISFLLKQNLAAITIHARIAKDMSRVPANWKEIKKSVELKNKICPQTLIIGNGDVKDYVDGLKKAQETGVDGIMTGTGVFKNIFAFDKKPKKHTPQEMLKLLLFHARLFDKTWGKHKNFAILKKFFKIYVIEFPGASDLRAKLMLTKKLSEIEEIISSNILIGPVKLT